MIKIHRKVGPAGTNEPMDVLIVQYLLNMNSASTGLTKTLGLSGDFTRDEEDAVKMFQSKVLGIGAPNGRVDPGGQTLKKLALAVPGSSTTVGELRKVLKASSDTTGTRPGEGSSAVGLVDIPRFVRLFERQFGKLGASARQGLVWLLQFINADADLLDIGHVAYVLATVKREAAETWMPVEEGGKGRGKAYGNSVAVTDASGVTRHNKYYGRGYVQITWEPNYRRLGREIGMGDELVYDPRLALDPVVAYKILSVGMRAGLFTTNGYALADFINPTRCDYVGARRIVNGTDVNTLLADWATRFEVLLRISC